MEFIIELLFSILGEICLQIVFEVLADFGLKSFAETMRAKKRNPILAFVGFALLGIIAGGLSLLLFRNHLLKPHWLRVTWLVIMPLMVGKVMSLIGSFWETKHRERTRLETFINGWAFALAMGLVRFFFAK